MRILVIACFALVAACSHGADDSRSVAAIQQCQQRFGNDALFDVDVLFVVDASPAMAPLQAQLASQLPGAIDRVLAGLRLGGTRTWLHIGVVTADGAGGARLRSGCGIMDGRPFVDDLVSDGEVLTNVDLGSSRTSRPTATAPRRRP